MIIETDEHGRPVNRYGTRISVHTCRTCGRPFTVCPPVIHMDWGGVCLDVTCISYDPARDADKLFDNEDPRIRREDL